MKYELARRTLLAMELLRRYPGFRRLWASQLVSLTGDWLSFVAVSLLALDQGAGVLALAFVLVAHSLPQALMAPFAGALSDRFDRVRLLWISNVVQATLTLGMVAAVWADSLVLVQLLLVLRAAAAAFVMPAENAALPRLVARRDLLGANALLSATWSVAFTLGMGLGGVVALLGAMPALLLDAATFALAAWIVGSLPAIAPERDDSPSTWRSLAAIRRDMGEGAGVVLHDRLLLGAVLAKMPLSLAGGSAWVLLNLVASDPAFVVAGSLGLGLLHATRGVGTGLGPLLAAGAVERGSDEHGARSAAAWLCFGAIALLSLQPHWLLVLLAVLLWGLGTGANWVLSTAAIQRGASDEVLGRVSAIDGLLSTAAMAAGALLGAIAVELSSSPSLAGWLAVLLGVGSWCLARHVVGCLRGVEGRPAALRA